MNNKLTEFIYNFVPLFILPNNKKMLQWSTRQNDVVMLQSSTVLPLIALLVISFDVIESPHMSRRWETFSANHSSGKPVRKLNQPLNPLYYRNSIKIYKIIWQNLALKLANILVPLKTTRFFLNHYFKYMVSIMFYFPTSGVYQ